MLSMASAVGLGMLQCYATWRVGKARDVVARLAGSVHEREDDGPARPGGSVFDPEVRRFFFAVHRPEKVKRLLAPGSPGLY